MTVSSSEREVATLVAERFAVGQLQIGGGFLGGKTIGEAERAAARARAVAAPEAKALELERGARAIAASQLPRVAERLGRAEFSDAGQPGIRARANGDRSPAGEMGGGLADQQLAVEDRDDRAGRGQKTRVGNVRPARNGDAQRKSARLELAFTQQPADIADREDAEKALDARTNLELRARVVVELRNFLDRHLRFAREVLDGPLVNGSHRLPWTRRSWTSSQLEAASMLTPITESMMAIARFGSPRRSQMFTA